MRRTTRHVLKRQGYYRLSEVAAISRMWVESWTDVDDTVMPPIRENLTAEEREKILRALVLEVAITRDDEVTVTGALTEGVFARSREWRPRSDLNRRSSP